MLLVLVLLCNGRLILLELALYMMPLKVDLPLDILIDHQGHTSEKGASQKQNFPSIGNLIFPHCMKLSYHSRLEKKNTKTKSGDSKSALRSAILVFKGASIGRKCCKQENSYILLA